MRSSQDNATSLDNKNDGDDDYQYSMDLRISQDPNSEKIKDVTIHVIDPITREEKFNKYTVYNVKGFDRDGEFEVGRRYSDFSTLRELMILRWPGCYIPSLPAKQSVGNMDKKFIEDRRRHLDKFCEKVSEISYLHYSQEYQIFLRGGSDFAKAIIPCQKVNSDDIISKYTVTFNHLSGKELNKKTVDKIVEFKTFLLKVNNLFENFKNIAKSMVAAKQKYYDSYGNFLNYIMPEYEKTAVAEYSGSETKFIFADQNNLSLKESVERVKAMSARPSLEYYYEWVKQESREIIALIEAIDQRDRYETIKLKAQDRQKTETADLQNILAGKTSIKNFFSKKPKEEAASDLEKQIALTTKEIENLSLIHDMITLILAYDEIDQFKESKKQRYYWIIKMAALSEMENVKDIGNFWYNLTSNELVKGGKAE